VILIAVVVTLKVILTEKNAAMNPRNGLVVNDKVTLVNGYGEREAAIDMLAELPCVHRKTVAADKNYDTKDFVAGCQGMNVTPHVAQNIKRKDGFAIDGRTTRHEGYALSTKNRSVGARLLVKSAK
jgi:hypothetical protein